MIKVVLELILFIVLKRLLTVVLYVIWYFALIVWVLPYVAKALFTF